MTFSLAYIPMVMGFTWFGKHYPPPLNPTNMRRLAFLLLIIIGVGLMVKNL